MARWRRGGLFLRVPNDPSRFGRVWCFPARALPVCRLVGLPLVPLPPLFAASLGHQRASACFGLPYRCCCCCCCCWCCCLPALLFGEASLLPRTVGFVSVRLLVGGGHTFVPVSRRFSLLRGRPTCRSRLLSYASLLVSGQIIPGLFFFGLRVRGAAAAPPRSHLAVGLFDGNETDGDFFSCLYTRV